MIFLFCSCRCSSQVETGASGASATPAKGKDGSDSENLEVLKPSVVAVIVVVNSCGLVTSVSEHTVYIP